MRAEPAEARYRTGSDNRLLLFGLWRAHKLRCYWCAEPKEFRDLQVDHILPQTATDRQLTRLAAELGQPLRYDVHDPYNLAPICGPCNNEKRQHDFTATPRILSLLKAARRVRPDVVKQVELLLQDRDFTELLLQLERLDLRAGRADLAELAPLLVERLAAVDPGLIRYPLRQSVRLDDRHSHTCPVRLELDVADVGRRELEALARFGSPPQTWLEALWSEFGDNFDELVRSAVDEVENAADLRIEPYGRVGLANYSLAPDELIIHIVDTELHVDDELTLILRGDVESQIHGTGVFPRGDGVGLEDFLVDAQCTVSFSAELHADPGPAAATASTAGDFEAGTSLVELYEPDLPSAAAVESHFTINRH